MKRKKIYLLIVPYGNNIQSHTSSSCSTMSPVLCSPHGATHKDGTKRSISGVIPEAHLWKVVASSAVAKSERFSY